MNADVNNQFCHAKYVFMDVVGFMRARTIRAQSHVVQQLNQIVREAVEKLIPKEHEDSRKFLPMGDGICIVIKDYKSSPDPELKIATEILKRLHEYNSKTSDESHRFQVRIGINENMDQVVEDINRERNLVGAGINYARRIMDLADGGQILVGPASYHALRQYYPNSFRHFVATVKHGVRLDVYQYLENDWLNVETPKAFETQ